MKIYIIAMLYFVFTFNLAPGQTNINYLYDDPASGLVAVSAVTDWYSNLQKYWYYRYRLVNDFMIIGDNAGESLPASRRNRGDDDNFWPDVERFYGTGFNCQNMLDWGTDNTIDLGNYLSTLATEYKQLRDFNFPTDRTLAEIQHAQNALNRLCTNSIYYESDHTLYPGSSGLCTSCPSSNPGYFLRDDVPFLTITDPNAKPLNYEHFNRQGLHRYDNMFIVNKASGAFRTSFCGPNPGSSYAPSYIYPPTGSGWHNPDCESQDQLISIFLGEALLTKYLYGGPESSIPTLLSQSQEGLYYVISWPNHFDVSSGSASPGYYSIPDVEFPIQCAKNDCSQTGILFPSSPAMLDGVHQLLAITGADASLQSSIHGIRNAIRWNNTYCVAFQNEAWYNPECDNSFPNKIDISYTDAYVSFANDWAKSASPGWDWLLAPSIYFNYLTGADHDNWSWNTITRHATSDAFGEPHIPMIYELNNGYRNWGQIDNVKNLLDNAPCCGPWNNELADAVFTHCSSCGGSCSTCEEDYWNSTGTAYPAATTIEPSVTLSEWSGNDALWDPTHRQPYGCYAGGSPGNFASEFNGVDYMQLFNLYSLERKQAYDGSHISTPYIQGMINPYYCENYDVNYPDNVGYGCNAHKLHLNWLEYISAIDKVHASGNGWVEFRGAKVIDLYPGFEAEHGSFFNGYIQDYSCHGAENNDSSYNFATVDVPGPEHKDMRGDDSTGESTREPIAYFPKGLGNFPTKSNVSVNDGYEDPVRDSLLNDPGFLSEMQHYGIIAAFNSTTDPDLLDALKQLYGWNDDSIAKYKINRDDEIIVNLAPNPTNDKAYLSYSITKDKIVNIILTNMLGQDFSYLVDHYDVNQIAGSYKITLNTDNLVPGMYIVKIAIGNQSFSKKLSVLLH